MGRPINDKWFGPQENDSNQIAITAKLPGEPAGTGYIIKQSSTREYRVNVNGTIGDVTLVNTITPENLNDGEAFIQVTPYGGEPSACYKLTQHNVTVYSTPDSGDDVSVTMVWGNETAQENGAATVYGADGVIVAPIDVLAISHTLVYAGDVAGVTTTLFNDDFVYDFGNLNVFTTSDNTKAVVVSRDRSAVSVDTNEGVWVQVFDVSGSTVVPIGYSKLQGNASRLISGDERRYSVVQLTDTKYACITDYENTPVTEPQYLIFDVDLATGAATVSFSATLESVLLKPTLDNHTAGPLSMFAIDATKFGIVYGNVGVEDATETNTSFGSLRVSVFDAAGAQVSDSLLLDVNTAANLATTGSTGSYLTMKQQIRPVLMGASDDVLTLSFAVVDDNFNIGNRVCRVTCKFAAGYTSISSVGAFEFDTHDAATYGNEYHVRVEKIDNAHLLEMTVDRNSASGYQGISRIINVNDSTLVTTYGAFTALGTTNHEMSSPDFSICVESATTAWALVGIDDFDFPLAPGDIDYTVPFTGTRRTGYRFVDNIANIGTSWPAYTGEITESSTGNIYNIAVAGDPGSATLLTTNTDSASAMEGAALYKMTLDIGTLTVTYDSYHIVMSEYEPMYTDAATINGRHCGNNDIGYPVLYKIGNDKFGVMIGNPSSRYYTDQPYMNATDYAAGFTSTIPTLRASVVDSPGDLDIGRSILGMV